jgi:DNA helicase IV
MNRSIAAHNEMRQRQAELLHDFDKEKKDTFAITADMTRQYKAMQEELLKRLNVLENTIQEQKDQLGECGLVFLLYILDSSLFSFSSAPSMKKRHF